jgi:hypothetical protein
MEKKVIEEISRVREIMGLKLITERTFGPPKFLDELFQELAEKARTGDSALAGRFDDFLEGLKKTGKDVGDLNDYAFGAKNAGRDITDDLGDQLDDVYKFVDELVTDSGNGTIWKTYLTDALKNSSDNVFKSIGDQLDTAKNTLKNMKGYDDEAHDAAVDALEYMKKLINNSTLDENLKPIIRSRYGLDDIPAKRVANDVSDEVSDEVREVLKKFNWNTSWDDIKPSSQELLDNIDTIAGGGFVGKFIDFIQSFLDFFKGEETKMDEILSLMKSYSTAQVTEQNAIRERISKLITDLTKTRLVNFTNYQDFIKNNIKDYDLKNVFLNAGLLKSAKALSDDTARQEWEKTVGILADRRAKIRDQFLQLFAPSWVETWKKLAPRDAKGAIPGSFFRKWKTILAGKEFKELRWSTIWGFTLNPSEMKQLFKTFGIKKGITSLTQEYITRLVWYSLYVSLFDTALDLIGFGLYQIAIIRDDEEMVKNPNNLYWKFVATQYEDFERHFNVEEEKSEIEYDDNGNPIEKTEFQKTVDGLQDIAEFLLRIPKDNLASIAVPGLADDFIRFVGSLNDPIDKEKLRKEGEQLAEDLQTGRENAQQGANEAASQLGIPPPNSTSVREALDNLPQRTEDEIPTPPPTPPTPTETTTSIKPGSATEDDKKSLKQQMNDDNYFDTEIISVDSIGGGRIKVTYKSKNPSGTNKYNELEKNSEGNWIYTYGTLKGQIY